MDEEESKGSVVVSLSPFYCVIKSIWIAMINSVANDFWSNGENNSNKGSFRWSFLLPLYRVIVSSFLPPSYKFVYQVWEFPQIIETHVLIHVVMASYIWTTASNCAIIAFIDTSRNQCRYIIIYS